MEKKNKRAIWIIFRIISVVVICSITNRTEIIANIGKAIMPFLMGAILALILNMPLNIIEKKLFRLKTYNKKIRVVSILLSVIIFILIIVLINFLVIPQLIDAVNTMVDKLPSTLEKLNQMLTDVTKENEEISKSIAEKLNENQGNVQEMITKVVSSIAIGIKSVVSKVVDLVIAFVFSIYLLANKEKMQKGIKKITIAYLQKEKQTKVFNFLEVCSNSFYNFVTGQCKEAIILGTLCTIGMLILKIPYAVVIGAITMFTAFIPLVGAWFSGILGFLLIITVNPIKALIFVIFIVILQLLENTFIYPKVVGKSIKVPSMLTLIAITLGGRLFGIIGIILGVPLVSVIYVVFNQNTTELLKDRHEEIST